MDENIDEPEIIKAKKIRRAFLLKVDSELKADSKKNINLKINSKTIKELNQAYDPYSILLSKSSPIYSNYVEFFCETRPIIYKKQETHKKMPKNNTEEKNINSSNSSLDSSPVLNFIPKKIDLGQSKLSSVIQNSIKNKTSIKLDKNMITKEKNQNEEVDSFIKSIKFGNKSLYKLKDKIVCKNCYVNDDEDDNIIKNLIKLRKYCIKFIKKRKKIKKSLKVKKSFSPNRRGKEKVTFRANPKKRPTYIRTNTLVMHSLLFRNKYKNKSNISEKNLSRENTYAKKESNFIVEKIENKNFLENKRSEKSHKLHSLKNLEIIRENAKEKINTDRKKTIRRCHSLIHKEGNEIKAIDNNENMIKEINKIIKEPTNSNKSIRQQNYFIINNHINNAKIIFKKGSDTRNSLFGTQRNNFNKQKIIKDKDKEEFDGKMRNSLRKTVKNTVIILSPEFTNFKNPSN
jgi:hypothetical protein